VRSHAKASTAGSTKRQASGLGRIFRGADAIRGISPRANGSGAPKARRLVLPLALMVALFSVLFGVGGALAAAPTISSTSVSSVTTKSALLEAAINPGGEATTYHFEYGPADCASNPCTSVPVPNGNVGSGFTAIEVVDEIAGLSPGTTYHFRVLATNGGGTSEGPDTVFKTYAPLVPNTECPNQAFRIGPSASLPDCRAYEMVSPVDKNGGLGWAPGLNVQEQTSPDGEKLAYSSRNSFGNPQGAGRTNHYVATRAVDGWSSENITPPGISLGGEQILSGFFYAFSRDLTSGWLWSFLPLNPGEPEGSYLYRFEMADGSYERLDVLPGQDAETPGRFSGASEGNAHQIFEAKEPLTPDAAPDTNAKQVYDLFGGELHLVSVLPHGEPFPPGQREAIAGSSTANYKIPDYRTNVVSDDGSRVFWFLAKDSFSGGTGRVFVRENPAEPQSALDGGGECTEPDKACTHQLLTGEENRFLAASPDGSKALIAGEGNLTRVDVDTKAATLIAGELVEHNPGGFSSAVSSTGVLGASEDLSRVYFVSREDLAPGGTAGANNLYLDDEGAKTFVASLTELDTGGAGSNAQAANPVALQPDLHMSSVSPDGRHVAFTSSGAALAAQTAGYDNTDVNSGEPALEVYLYEVGGELICASCNPSGARPLASPLFGTTFGDLVKFEIPAAAWWPTASDGYYAPNALSEDGARAFFNSYDALLPQDTNGKVDVYQWEAPGSGDCEVGGSGYSEANGGCISLISTGKSAEDSEFIDARGDGRDVFFHTESDIDPRDPGVRDIYNARSGGGFPLPVLPPPCVGDACQNVPAAPDDPTPASASFKGPGNPLPIADCGAQARQAAKLRRAAKRLRRAADRSDSAMQAKSLGKRSVRLGKRAKGLSKRAARCRRANRGAAR
jgi:WD40-like Beta Propeller Repeat